MTYGITVEQLPDSGAPQVGITVDGLDGAAVISVEVSWDGGESWHGVRGAQRVEVVGGAFFRDHVPPLNVEARYRLVVHSGTLLPRYTYAWASAAHASESIEYDSGVEVRRNLVQNPSFEVDTSGVAAASGITVGRVTTAHPSRVGGYMLGINVPAGATSSQYVVQDAYLPPGVTPGQWVAASALVGRSTGSTYGRISLQFRDAAGAAMTLTHGQIQQLQQNDLSRWSIAAQVPEGAARARVLIYAFSSSGGDVAVEGRTLSDAWVVTAGHSAQAAALASVATYFDGDSPDAPAPTEATITVASDTAWLQDPLNPRSAVPVHLDARGGGVILASGALASAVWRQEVDTVLPMGASLPVSSIGQRVRAGEVPLRMLHDVAAEGGALRRLLLSSGQLVLRGAPTSLLDPVAHIVVGDAEQTVYGSTGQVSEWDLSVQQVRPQSLRLVVPWFTYQQVQDLWAGFTYDSAKSSRPGDTYLDWLRDPTVP